MNTYKGIKRPLSIIMVFTFLSVSLAAAEDIKHYTIWLENFLQVETKYGEIFYKPVHQVGIPITDRILVVEALKGDEYMDDAVTEEGLRFVFYYMDAKSGMKALISSEPMEVVPLEQLPESMRQFRNNVIALVEDDGGPDAVYGKFHKEEVETAEVWTH